MSSDEDIFGEEKRRRIQVSDDENDEIDKVAIGNELDELEDGEKNQQSDGDGLEGLGLSDEDDDRDEEPVTTTRNIRVLTDTIPRFPRSHVREPGSDTYFARVPAFLTIDPQPFDSTKFLKSVGSGAAAESASESHKIRLQNENTIRWRYAKEGEGKVTKQSNARFVKWSDGSYSLEVGSEMFDVAVQTPYEQNFLCLSYPQAQMLHTQALLTKTMSIRPSSTQSQTHKRLTAELARRAESRSALVQNVATLDDPEKRQQEAERVEGQLLKARRKLEAKQRQQEERVGGSGRGPMREVSYGMMEDEEEGAGIQGSGRFRHEEYEEDDFVVEEDEEEGEEGEDGEERDEEEQSEEELDDLEKLEQGLSGAADEEADRKRAGRLHKAKRDARSQEKDDEPRKKVRRIISDDDEE